MGAGPQPRRQGQVQQEEGGCERGQHVGSSCSRGRWRAKAAQPRCPQPRALSVGPRGRRRWREREACAGRGVPGCRRGRCSRSDAARGWVRSRLCCAAAARLFMVWPAGAGGGPRPGRPPWPGSRFAGKRGAAGAGSGGGGGERPGCREEKPTLPRGTWAGRSQRPLPREALWEREAGAAIGAQDGVGMERKRGAKGGTK